MTASRGVIKFVTDRGVLVWLSSHIEGFIAKTLLGVKDEAMFQSMFKVGMGVSVIVLNANEKRTNVVLSLQGERKDQVIYRYLYRKRSVQFLYGV